MKGYHKIILTRLTCNGKESPDHFEFVTDIHTSVHHFLLELRYREVWIIKRCLEECRYKPSFLTIDTEAGISTDRTSEIIPEIIHQLDKDLGLHRNPTRCSTKEERKAALDYLEQLGCTIPE